MEDPQQDNFFSREDFLDQFKQEFTREVEGQPRDYYKRTNKAKQKTPDDPLDHNENELLKIPFGNELTDASNTKKIQTLREFIDDSERQVRNPEKRFFNESKSYYTGKYKDNNHKQIKVSSFLSTTDRKLYLIHQSLEIIQTQQGCMPIIKTFEKNAYDDSRFVKSLRFYDYKGDYKAKDGQDIPLLEKFIIDEGQRCPEFKTYDISLLHFENSIIFYQRKEKWHKLMKYDAVTRKVEEIPGYNIEEDVGNGIRLHIIISNQFGKNRKSALNHIKTCRCKESHQDIKSNEEFRLHQFLSHHYVFCQRYKITEELQYVNYDLIGYQMHREWNDVQQEKSQYQANREYQNRRRLPLINFHASQEDVNYLHYLKHPIQQVCHILVVPDENEEDNADEKQDPHVTFVAFDAFQSHHFQLQLNDDNRELVPRHPRALQNDMGPYKTFYGNNETHLQQEIKDDIKNEIISRGKTINTTFYEDFNDVKEQSPHEKRLPNIMKYCPFLKHFNSQFIIQVEKIQDPTQLDVQIDQYFHITNNNEYMLVYPNYDDEDQKKKAIMQLAQRFQYNPNPDIDYSYQDDYNVRKRDLNNNIYKKVSHICINDYNCKNHIKRVEHIEEVLERKEKNKLTVFDTIILSTDEQTNLIYVYQPVGLPGGENKIDIYFYENNIVNTNQASTLPTQIFNLERLFKKKYKGDKLEYHKTYYINSVFRDVVSSTNMITAEWQLKKQLNEDMMNNIEQINIEISDQENEQDVGLIYFSDPTYKGYLPMSAFIDKNSRFLYSFIENPDDGQYLQIQTHALRPAGKPLSGRIFLEMYSHNKEFFTFFFRIEKSQKDRNNVLYFIVRRDYNKIISIGKSGVGNIIEGDEQEVSIFENYNNSGKSDEILSSYLSTAKFEELLERIRDTEPENPESLAKPKFPYGRVHLTFEKCMDSKQELNYIPLVYQLVGEPEKQIDFSSHHFIVFDVKKQKIIRQFNMLPNQNMREYLKRRTLFEEGERGEGVYTITRTSEVYNQSAGFMTNHTCKKNERSEQVAKYQVAAQFVITDGKNNNNKQVCTLEFQEFCVHSSCCGQNRIQLIGIKQILISPTALRQKPLTWEDLFIIPWVEKNEKFKGSQLVLRREGEGQNKHLQVVRMLDQNINNIYQHQNETIQFGYTKFLTSQESQDDYILLLCSQLKHRVYFNHYFENSESYFIHHRVIKKLLSMKLGKFEQYVLNDDFKALMREEFFQSQEVLSGKTINDLCLQFPKEVAHGLKQSEDQYKQIHGSLIEELCNKEQTLMEYYIKMDLCEYNLLIQLDFNFTSSLRIAAELNSNQAVKQILTKIFEQNQVVYKDIFMMELPKLLQLPRIERLYNFLSRDYAEKRANKEQAQQAAHAQDDYLEDQFLNMERVINHPDLDAYLKNPYNYHIKWRFDDYHQETRELTKEIMKHKFEDEKKVKSIWDYFNCKKRNKVADNEEENEGPEEVEERNVKVEHTTIIFTKMIIGEKIRYIQEHDYRHVNFNDNHLAGIFWIEDEEHIDFYNQEAVRKIIDFQFDKTREFVQFIMVFYVIGFLLPYIISLSSNNAFFLNIFYIIMLFTQIFFMIFEGMQMKEQKWDYFNDIWNLIDSTQFLMFLTLYYIKMKNQFQSDSMFEILMQSAILLQSFGKMTYFMRVYESINMTYTIMNLVVREVKFLGMIAFLLLLAYTKQFTVMHYGINDPEGEYKGLNSQFLKLIIQSYKSIKGEVSIPHLDEQMSARTKDTLLYRDIMMSLNFVVWVMQEATFVFLSAFFFAQVYQYCEKYLPQIETYWYKTKAQFNNECYDIVDMFKPQRNFKAICFAIAQSSEQKGTFMGPTGTIKKLILEQNDKRMDDFVQDSKTADKRHKTLEEVNKIIKALNSELDDKCSECHGFRTHRHAQNH